MSKLIEKLNKIATGDTAPIGFATSSSKKSQPQLITVAEAALKGKLSSIPAGADAVLFQIEDVAAASDSLKTLAENSSIDIWGVASDSIGKKEAALLSDIGCDFMVLSPLGSSAILAYEGGPGKILRIDTGMEDMLLRTINMFDVDAVLLDDSNDAVAGVISIEQAMKYRRVSAMIEVPLIVALPPGTATDGIDVLADAGVNGISLQWRSPEDENNFAQLQKAIESLPAKTGKKRGKGKSNAKLPSFPVQPQEDEF